jgi:SAM-dependent methyltransferase
VSTNCARYDRIGFGYSRFRREDPRLAARIHAALGDARTVVNVGAGAGSYEPRDRHVVAIEPSDVMAAQRPRELPPAIRAFAADLPLYDDGVDAAMSVLSLHHWDEAQELGVRELRRVAKGNVVIVTYDVEVGAQMWLHADYFPELVALDQATFPAPKKIAEWLGGARIETVLIPSDCSDWMLGAWWAHPERVLDADARAATSGFARQPVEVVERVVRDVRRDLEDGTWDERHGHLRSLDAYDAGLRIIVGEATR